MADKEKKEIKEKKPNGFATKVKAAGKFFRDCKAEIKKIVWPAPKSTFKNMGVVLVAMVVLGLFIFGLDTAFGKLLGLIMDIAVA